MKRTLEQYLEECISLYDLPGLCFSVKTLGFCFHGVAGYRNNLTKERLKKDDVFHMASVAKLFVGTAIMMLWEEKKLSLEDRVTDILPWLTINDARFKRVTLRQMLTHTAGMEDVKDCHWEMAETDEAALMRYAKSREVVESKLLWDPEEGRFCYSNMAYEILGLVIEQISGLLFEEYIQKYIFAPLEMNDSSFLTFKREPSHMADPHGRDENGELYVEEYYPYNRAHAPSSTLTSTAVDMQKWGDAHIHNKLLRAGTYNEIWKSYADVEDTGEGMGISWFLRSQRGYTLMGHEGNDDGFRASFWVCPELCYTISVMSNTTRSPAKRMNRRIFDILIDSEEAQQNG